MARGKVLNKNPQEGDIKIMPSSNAKWMYTNGKWVYVKKPREEWNMPIAKPKLPKPKPVFPPVNLPDHIKATKYPNYYISSDGISYREPRPIDASGRFGEINQWGLIEMKTQLRGNPYDKSKMYEGVNIYFYDTDDEGNFIDEFPNIAVYECRFDKDTGWETLTTDPPIISFNAEEFEQEIGNE